MVLKTNKVIVIGAGLSGLTAAFQLKKELPEVEVTVLEANSLPGGRLHTTEFGGEGGGETIGLDYTNVHKLAAEIGFTFQVAPLKAFDFVYYFKNQDEWIKQKEWRQWAGNPLPTEIKGITPTKLLRYYISKFRKSITFDDATCSNTFFQELSQKSLEVLLMELNVPPEAISIIKVSAEYDDIAKVSAFNVVMNPRYNKLKPEIEYCFVPGGMQKFVNAIAAHIQNIRYNQKVVSVRTLGDKHEVQTESGERFICDTVIFSVPAGPMRSIEIDPPLTGLQKEAFEIIQYSSAIKTFFRASFPFWEKDKLPLMMWTDTNINLVLPVYDINTRLTPLSGPDIWGICVFSNCLQAERLIKAEEQDHTPIADSIQHILEVIRPSTKGCLEYVDIFNWKKKETAMGAYHYYRFSPKIPSYYQAIGQPTMGRFFAGDHTVLKTRGLNAAVDSGFRVANEIIANYTKKIAHV